MDNVNPSHFVLRQEDPHTTYLTKSREALLTAFETATAMLKSENVEDGTKLYLIRILLDHSQGKRE